MPQPPDRAASRRTPPAHARRRALWRCAALGVLAALGLAGFAAVRAQTRDPAPETLTVHVLAPVLAAWIEQSRDAALAQGVEPIPDAIRAALRGHVPDEILARVRWRQGGAGATSLQQHVFYFETSPAVTLDHVIVFAERAKALEDSTLWAHELVHVRQFADWGVAGFARRYLADRWAVEREAVDFRWEYMKRAGLVPPPLPSRAP